MILPTKTISPDRALLTIAGSIFERLSEASTVSKIWDDIRERYAHKPISYSWFILAVDLLFVMNTVYFDQDGLLTRTSRQMNAL